MFLEPDLKWSSSLPCVFHVAVRASQLVNTALVIFVHGGFFCGEVFFNCVVCVKSNSYVCVSEQFCNESGFFSDVCKLCPYLFLFLCVIFSFFLLVGLLCLLCVIFIVG